MSNFSPETAGWWGGRLRLVAIPQILIQSPLLPAFPVLSQKVPISATVSGDSDSTSPTSDSDYDTDSDLARVLAPNLNPNLRVAKIQLEVKRFLLCQFQRNYSAGGAQHLKYPRGIGATVPRFRGGQHHQVSFLQRTLRILSFTL